MSSVLERLNCSTSSTKWVEGKLKDLETHRNRIKTTLGQLNTCLEFIRKTLKAGGNKEDMPVLKINTAKQVQELSASFHLK